MNPYGRHYKVKFAQAARTGYDLQETLDSLHDAEDLQSRAECAQYVQIHELKEQDYGSRNDE